VKRSAGLLPVALALLTRAAVGQDSTANPHGPLRIPCAECHSSGGWRPAKIAADFDHAKLGFTLVGAHVQASCRSCHARLSFQGTPRQCAACHTDPHRGEVGPGCERCHTSRSFIDRSLLVSAHELTAFPLTGAHLAADCESCHLPGAQGKMTFVGVPADCYNCHRQNFATANPDHGGFPTNCVECHTTATWLGANFNHQATRFPLTGAHLAVACNVCHADKVFAGKSTACVSCHLTDYNATTSPQHQAAQFPTDCATCHTTVTWSGATFNHDGPYFPIYSGTHQGKWTACTDCHLNPADFSTFTCIACHAHSNQTQVDGDHKSVKNYTYDSNACYQCHRNGNAG